MKRILIISFCLVAAFLMSSSCSHKSSEMVEGPFNIAEEIGGNGGGEAEIDDDVDTDEDHGLGVLPQKVFHLKKISYSLFDPETQVEIAAGEVSANYDEDGRLTSVEAVENTVPESTPWTAKRIFSYNPPGIDTAENGQLSKVKFVTQSAPSLTEYLYNAGLLSEIRVSNIDASDPNDEKILPSTKDHFSHYHTSVTAMMREMTANRWDDKTGNFVYDPSRTEETMIDRSPFGEKVSQDSLPTSSKACRGTDCKNATFDYDGMRIISHRVSVSTLPDIVIAIRCNPGADCEYDSAGRLSKATYNIVNKKSETITGRIRITAKGRDEEGNLTGEIVEFSHDGGGTWTKLADRSYAYEMKELFIPPLFPPALIAFPELRELPKIHKLTDPLMKLTITTLLYNDRADLLLGTHGLVVR